MSFDLVDSSHGEARYVRVQYIAGDDIELDAITALNYNTPPADETPPVIEEIDDFWIWLDDNSTEIRWSAHDATPWSFMIYVDSVLILDSPWYGSIVAFNFVPESIGLSNVTLVLYDAFGNMAMDVVLIEVRSRTGMIVAPLILVGTGVALVVFVQLIRRRYAT